jgi:tetratricopeptide (TPR) repeat protein
MDPRSSDAWMARGTLMARRNERTYEGALPAFERALVLDARNAEAWHQYGTLLMRLKHDSAATVALGRALEVEPGRPITLVVLAAARSYARDLTGALRWADSALAIDPEFAYGYVLRSVYRLDLGQPDGARSDAETAVRLGWSPLIRHVTRAILAARGGDSLALRASLDSVNASVAGLGELNWRTMMHAARAWLAAGDPDRALDCLERVEPRGVALSQVLLLPDFDPLRALPRFQRLVVDTQPPGSR